MRMVPGAEDFQRTQPQPQHPSMGAARPRRARRNIFMSMGLPLSALFGVLLACGSALAGPIEDAQAQADKGAELMKKAENARRKKNKPELYAGALKQYATAHKIIVSSKLQNDAPELFAQITAAISKMNETQEVQTMRRDLLKQAIDAAVAEKLSEAYDRLADLRDLDPRIKTVEYALNVVGEFAGGN